MVEGYNMLCAHMECALPDGVPAAAGCSAAGLKKKRCLCLSVASALLPARLGLSVAQTFLSAFFFSRCHPELVRLPSANDVRDLFVPSISY